LLPLGGIGFRRRGHREVGGRAISRVLFARMAGRWSSLWDGCRQPPRAAYPQLNRPGPGLAAYLALLQLGVTVPRLLPGARWALTPPFHPYPWIKGGLFSVALSVASRRPGVTWQSALGARTFLSTPFQPACRDHRALPPPVRKTTGRVGASLALKPPQQPPQAVRWQALAAGRWGGVACGDPEAVAFAEHHLPDA